MVEDRTPKLVFVANAASLLGADGVRFDAFLRDLDGVGHLLGGGSGERAEEPLNIDAAVAHLGVNRLVHCGEEFVAEFVEDLVDVQVGHSGANSS